LYFMERGQEAVREDFTQERWYLCIYNCN
jgi:hypothetical protein